MKPLVIFGTGPVAEVAAFYFRHDSPRRVVAFTVDAQFLQQNRFLGLPAVPFESVTEQLPPAEHDMFVAISYTRLNTLRAERCAAARAMGYTLASYVSSRATVWPDLRHGQNCFLLEDNTIQPYVRIGDNVTLWSGNHIGHHATIGDNVFVSSHVVVSGGVSIGDNCFLGVNATIRDHVKLGRSCVIGAGALIVEDAADEGVYTAPAAERSRVPSSRLRRI